jgi:signal transduction histidine kinase
VDVRTIADAAIRVHNSKISVKRLRLLKDAPHEAIIKAHTGEMLQVLSNHLSNAIDALPMNGTIRIRIRRVNDSVQLTLADDGHGIPNDLICRIFEPFFTTKGEHGTGLGLAISKSIIERHSGCMRIRSSVRSGRSGTTFELRCLQSWQRLPFVWGMIGGRSIDHQSARTAVCKRYRTLNAG